MDRYLQEQVETLLPTIAYGLPPDTASHATGSRSTTVSRG
jgi:hypothetical protein